MKRITVLLVSLVSHRLLMPLILALFLLCYIAVAFFTDEALVTMVQLVGHNAVSLGLLALLAVNALSRLFLDLLNYRLHRSVFAGLAPAVADPLCRESLVVTGELDNVELARILSAEGYRVTGRKGFVAARRGVGLLLPRLLWRLALGLLFAGVAVSLSSRRSLRMPVIEGETLQVDGTRPYSVGRIVLEDVTGHWFLQRRLEMTLTGVDGRRYRYGIYPPGLVDGNFLYPRYLALAPLLRFTLPGVRETFEGYRLVMLYPPGREDNVELSAGYGAQLSMIQREGMPDPFVSGRFDLHVKLQRGGQLVAEGDAPFGGHFAADGFAVSLLDARRYVVTDMVRDYGVPCIWAAFLLVLLAIMVYLPLRCFWPRREMLFAVNPDGAVSACCAAEGRRRGHEALFHDLLDRVCRDARCPDARP